MKKSLRQDSVLAARYLSDLSIYYFNRNNNEIVYFNLIFSIAMAHEPDLILELGTGAGVSTRAFVRTLQYYNSLDQGERVLHTCDIRDALINQVVRKYGNVVVPHLMTTDELAAQWATYERPISLLYIDAEHTHVQSLKDFDQFANWIIPDGLILMHDTFPLNEGHEDPKYSGDVWKTARYFKQHYQNEFEVMTLPFLSGISIIRKKGKKYF